MDENESERIRALASQMVDDYLKRQIHGKLTAKIIKSTPDYQLEQVIIDYIQTKLSDEESELSILSKMSSGFQAVYSTWILDSEVNNGGFNQFFTNSSGQFAEMALESLKLLGAIEHYSVLQKAIEIHEMEKRNPKLQDLYGQRTAEAFSASYQETKLDECDSAFYNLGNQLSELRLQYIRSHPKDFVGK
jgi:hypothetical protein